MYFLGSRLVTLLVLVVCPCRVCLGDDRVKSRTTVYKHLRNHGTSTNEEIRRHQAYVNGADYDDDNLDETDFEEFNGLGGGDEDQDADDFWENEFGEDGDNDPSDSEDLDGDGDDDDDDYDIDWEDDPIYHKLKPHVAEIVGGGLLACNQP